MNRQKLRNPKHSVRLNKFLSQCGVASRRAADDMIAAGKVSVNGEVVTKLGLVIDEIHDCILVNGNPCVIPAKHIFLLLNKPRGFLVTLKDSFGRKTIKNLIIDVPRRVYPVGRLDYDSEGLLLLTDDGELAFRLAHPKYGVKKVYTVQVKGDFKSEDLRHFYDGILLEDGHVAHARVKILERLDGLTVLSIELAEGRKREIRRMCKVIGYPVQSILRVKYDELTLQGVESGKWRYLSQGEVERLRRKVGLS
jgi:23S rRNA pseudouridine2605 synthase